MSGSWGQNGPCPILIQGIYFTALTPFFVLAVIVMAGMFLIYVPLIGMVKLLGCKWI